MKTSLKHALLNRYNLTAFAFVPIVSFFSFAINCGFFSVIDLIISGKGIHGEPVGEYLDIVMGFFPYAVWGFSFMQLLLPLSAAFVMLPYLREKRMFGFSYTRGKSYPNAVLKPMLRQLLIGCTVLFLGYMVFLTAGLVWKINPADALSGNFVHETDSDGADVLIDLWETDSEGVLTGKYPQISCNREFMPEIFGEYFAVKHMFLFFVADGFWKYFVFCFIYGLFSVSVSFYTKKDFLCLIVPTVYYIVFDLVFSGIGIIQTAGQTVIDLSLYAPSYPIMSGARNWISIPQVIYPLLPPLLFCIFTFVKEFAVKKKRGDAYAV